MELTEKKEQIIVKSSERSKFMTQNKKITLTVSFAAIMATFVCIATLMFTIYIPATGGYFNFGDSFVYISGILFGPLVGSFAGGIGSAIADLILGYPIFAVFTLIGKGVEGFLVGYLYRKLKNSDILEKFGKLIVIIVTIIAGILSSVILWDKSYEFLGIWLPYISLGASVVIISLVLLIKWNEGIKMIGIFSGGLFMIFTYLIAEYYILDFGVASFIEVPINILQVFTGLLIAIPITTQIEKINIIKTNF